MLNKIIIHGRMVREPELKKTQSGTSVASYTIACDRDFTSGNEKVTDFITCVSWRQTAEFISKYFNKGSEIIVEGQLHIDTYDKNGERRTRATVVADRAYFTGGKKNSAGDDYSENKPVSDTGEQVATFEEYADDGDLPF